MRSSSLVVFTDLDGTLLDHHTYSWAAAEEALEALRRRQAPLVFCTSKTRAEVEALRREMGFRHPFITENGGGIFIPQGYFPRRAEDTARVGPYHAIALARPYAEIVAELAAIAEESDVNIVGFHQMSAREIAQNTGLPPQHAELARHREFDEPFFFAGADESRMQRFIHLAKQRGIEIKRGGRFWHAFSGSDKGRAVRRLMKFYRASSRRRQRAAALGDSANDLAMLVAADLPVLLPRSDGSFDGEVLRRLPRVKRGEAPGPTGWNRAVLEICG